MPEWSNGAVSKTVVRASEPRVRIPLSPQSLQICLLAGFFLFENGHKASFERCSQIDKTYPKGIDLKALASHHPREKAEQSEAESRKQTATKLAC